MMWCSILFLVLLSQSSNAQTADAITANPCILAKTCGQCVAAGPDCSWCYAQGYQRPRCNLHSVHLQSDDSSIASCDRSKISYPSHSETFVKNTAPTSSDDPKKSPIQLSPQHLQIKLRPNQPYKLDITFRLAENYPVDLYYLMDLSKSMEDDKDQLAQVGDDLASVMNNITKNFQLGFGSFVDKTTMPYVSTAPGKLEAPCKGCDPPYGFKNQLPLDTNTAKFKKTVLDAPISGNLDGPEGGFDALMQAMSCKNQLNWRAESRKILMFSTDADFHYAGDGKLGGIVTPNDGHCHMSANKVDYTHSLLMDYPSIGQVAAKAKEERFTIIFAVTENQFSRYTALSKYIEASKTGILSNDSSNIVTLVNDTYGSISSTVELQTRDVDEQVNLKFKSKCKGKTLMETNMCSDLKIGEGVTFETEIFLPKCPAGQKEFKTSFDIYPVGLTESLRIDIEAICDCACGDKQENSPLCSGGQGTYRCGICECNDDRYGDLCQCNITEATSVDREAPCRRSNTSDVVCENRGECICGSCECFSRNKQRLDQKYSGDFCECDDYSCYFFDNQLCGGPTRGECKCGKCFCQDGYNGTDCGCPTDESTCMASNGEICNGKGECVCGVCECNITTNYRGPRCEDCPTCPGKCKEYKDCVQCVQFGTGELAAKYGSEGCKKYCTDVNIIEIAEAVENDPQKGIRKCQFRDDDDCTFFFNYRYIESKREYVVEVQRTKECVKKVNVLAIVLGVIGGIVAVGLALLLCWKLFTTIHDRREFAKFEKERQNAKWDTGENPIYKQATSTFKNPTYNKQ